MKMEDIELEVIMGENTSTIVTEAFLKLYENNAYKILDIEGTNAKDAINKGDKTCQQL